jgi:predicted phosphodiesterase
MLFIGDVHGKYKEYQQILKEAEPNSSLQVGDFGIGFKEPPISPTKHKFIRGNHDNPKLCQTIPNYLGDYGFDKNTGIFYVSGGFSMDVNQRTIGIDWWEDEQLSIRDLEKTIKLYERLKPEIVVSHECPESIVNKIHPYSPITKTRTNQALQVMFETHSPKFWVFGHYHISWSEVIDGCEFRCLSELQVCHTGIPEWSIRAH